MPPKPIKFTSLTRIDKDLRTGQFDKDLRTATTTQDQSARPQKLITERVTPRHISKNYVSSSAQRTEEFIGDHEAGSRVIPRENQQWHNRAKRPPSALRNSDNSLIMPDDKRQRSDQPVIGPGSGRSRGALQQQPTPAYVNDAKVLETKEQTETANAAFPVSHSPATRGGSTIHVLGSGVKVSMSQHSAGRIADLEDRSPHGTSGAKKRSAVIQSDSVVEEYNGEHRTSQPPVIDLTLDKANMEMDNTLQDLSLELRRLLTEKVHILGDQCGFAVHVTSTPEGDVIARFVQASRITSQPSTALATSDRLPLAHPSALDTIRDASGTSNAASPAAAPDPGEAVPRHYLPQVHRGVPLSARMEKGNHMPMNFHRRGNRETPPLPSGDREPSPDDTDGTKPLYSTRYHAREDQEPAQRQQVRFMSPPHTHYRKASEPGSSLLRQNQGRGVGRFPRNGATGAQPEPTTRPSTERGKGRIAGGPEGHRQELGVHSDRGRRA